jgi:hypothetical protein
VANYRLGALTWSLWCAQIPSDPFPAATSSAAWGERLAHVKRKLATTLVLTTALVLSMLATFSTGRPAAAAYDDPDTPLTIWPIDGVPTDYDDNVVVKWDDELLQTIRANPAGTGPTITARAIAVLHTAIYDAWAAYDPVPDGVYYTGKATGAAPGDKEKAISFAAHKTLTWLFPGRAALVSDSSGLGEFDAQMQELGYALNDSSPAANIGRDAAQATINFRKDDGANQFGDELGTPPADVGKPYADYTGYASRLQNTWKEIKQPWHWQPLCVPLPSPGQTTCANEQKPYTPQWGNVTAFALDAEHQYTPTGPPKLADGSYDPTDVATALKDTANLDDTKKVTAEYWADGPRSEFPPGHWALLAEAYSRERAHSVDTDVKMFFTMGNALLDASISSWTAKYTFDFWRPTSAIRYLYADKKVTSWLGPYQGYGLVYGSQWRPYQAPTVVTPPFPEYTSGHSTFSGAARITLTAFTGGDTFGGQVTIKAGKSLFEPGKVPARDVVLKWKTFLDAADQAGMSRRYGGIHFKSGDTHGRAAGATIGWFAYDRAKSYWEGRAR